MSNFINIKYESLLQIMPGKNGMVYLIDDFSQMNMLKKHLQTFNQIKT